MTPERAAAVLRGEKATSYDRVTAELMGADALEFCEWLLALDGDGMMKLHDVMDHWHGEDLFLDYCKAEWDKERKG